MRILLTGAEGQLGRVVRSGFGSHEVIAPSETELDICNRRKVDEALDRARPDLLLNAAAYTDVDGAESDPEAAFAGNARGPGILAVATEQRLPGVRQVLCRAERQQVSLSDVVEKDVGLDTRVLDRSAGRREIAGRGELDCATTRQGRAYGG